MRRGLLAAIGAAVGVLIAIGCGDPYDGMGTRLRRNRATSESPEGSDESSASAGAGIPCEVATLLETKCLACHGDVPAPGAQSTLVSLQNLLAPSKQDPTKNEAEQSLARMKDAASPMPPASYGNPLTPTEIATFDAWVQGGYQGSCATQGTDAPSTSANLTCTSCHGDPNRAAVTGADPNLAAAPPRNTKGETAATAKAVGAHQAHLTKGSMSNLVACSECHVVPTSTAHSNGVVGLTFGTLAKTGGKTPAWDGTGCTASYCHGSFTGGNAAAAPTWTGAAMTCTSCHEAPPATGDHRRGAHQFACSGCHGAGFTSTTVNKALHINGVKNTGGPGSNITSYNPATRACSSTCHGIETW